MQEILLMGNTEKPQDENRVKLVTAQVMYLALDADPVQFVTFQVMYAVQEEVIA